MCTKRFRITLSFAGEKRDFMKQVVRLLAVQFGLSRILYDKFHEAESAHVYIDCDLRFTYKNCAPTRPHPSPAAEEIHIACNSILDSSMAVNFT